MDPVSAALPQNLWRIFVATLSQMVLKFLRSYLLSFHGIYLGKSGKYLTRKTEYFREWLNRIRFARWNGESPFILLNSGYTRRWFLGLNQRFKYVNCISKRYIFFINIFYLFSLLIFILLFNRLSIILISGVF